MGKKSKQASGLAKAADRKIDKSQLPPPPPPPEEGMYRTLILLLHVYRTHHDTLSFWGGNQ